MNVKPISTPETSGQVSGAEAIMAKTNLTKIKQAGAQFEAVLLNSVFGSLEQTFSRLPGTHQDTTSKSYDSLAMQALTSGLAQSGGIGLGRLIAEKLMQSQRVKAF